MENLSRQVLCKIIISFYCQERRWTQVKLADKIDVNHASISNWMSGKKISVRNFNSLVSFLEYYVDQEKGKVNFNEYLLRALEEQGYDIAKCSSILDSQGKLTTKIKNLLDTYDTISPGLQNVLNIYSIIAKLNKIFYPYDKYFEVSNRKVYVDEKNPLIKDLFKCEMESSMQCGNYIILSFPGNYSIIIIFTNLCFDNAVEYGEYVKQIKERNNINLIIIITDNEIQFRIQKFFLENYNLFFETITSSDLEGTKISNVSIFHFKDYKKTIMTHSYAQAVFDRFTSYFAVIKNEVIFNRYEAESKNKSTFNLLEENNKFKFFADKILLKDIFSYSYLSRHTIYFERNCVQKEVEKMIEDNGNKRLNLVIEMCCPNALLSSKIVNKSKKVMLFTSSAHCVHEINKLNKDNDKKILPKNVQLEMTHIHPKYIANIYGDEIIGKVDLVILGFGMGSNIANITEYLRYINTWLSPNGRVFISFINADSALFQKQFDMYNRVETSPLLISDFGKHAVSENVDLLVKLKRYTLEEAKTLISTYVDSYRHYTYPFLSGLVLNADNEKNLVDEIREIDKIYALSDQCKHGHYITIIGKKEKNIQLHDETAIDKEKIIRRKIFDYLNSYKIDYEFIQHVVSIDTKSLLSNLLEQGEDISEFDLLKTVILQTKSEGNQSNSFIYVILPKENKISYVDKIRLVSEKRVTHMFGHGSISPLVILPSVEKKGGFNDKYYGLGLEKLEKEYVIFSSGINKESIKMRREVFINILQELDVELLNASSVIGF